MINQGKLFEQDFKNSIPVNVFFYRLRDGTGNFTGSKNENVRFQASNMCDYILFNGKLYLLELKSHTGKSLPFTAIRENQLKELSKAEAYPDIIPGLIINFRDIEKTYFVHIRDIDYYMTHSERKSIPVLFCQEYGVEIVGVKKKTRYRYLVDEWLKKMEEVE